MHLTVDVDPGILADIAQCFTEVARYAAMCAEIEADGGYDYRDADAVQADAGVQAIAILERLFPEIVTWRAAREEKETPAGIATFGPNSIVTYPPGRFAQTRYPLLVYREATGIQDTMHSFATEDEATAWLAREYPGHRFVDANAFDHTVWDDEAARKERTDAMQ